MKLLIELMLLGCSEYSARLRAKSIKHHRYVKWEQHLDRTYNKQSRYGEMFDIFHGARMMPNVKVSDRSQPPLTLDLSASESAGSDSLHRLGHSSQETGA